MAAGAWPIILNRKHILVVEADEKISRALSAKLEHAGYGVLKAVDGSEAVSAVRRENPDLIVIDTTFPPDVAHGGGVAWDGFLIMEWLHHMDSAQSTPVILISGADVAKYQERFSSAGVVAFFQKPINNEELLAAVYSVLNIESV
jgi:chemosensory pili system protein ChpA (sensor histidine kinase/response regulator)